MLKRFVIKMVLSALVLFLCSVKFNDITIGEKLWEYPLETAWKETGLPLQGVETESWLKVSRHWLSLDDLKALAGKIKKELRLTLLAKETSGAQKEFCYVSLEGRRSDQTVVAVTLQSLFNEGLPETQMGISTSHQGPVINLRQYVKDMQTSLTAFGSDLQFNLLLEGEHRGKILPENAREISSRAFRRIKADLVDSGTVGFNRSYKGYTRLLQQSARLNSQKVNIEIGTRYDSVRNTTQVLMATPNLADGV